MGEVMPKRYEFEEVKKICEDRGYELLETKYVNAKTKMKVKKNGYYGFINLSGIVCGEMLPFHKSNPFSIQNIQHYLNEQGDGAIILSTEYNNQKEKLKFRCSCGNIFYRNQSDLMATSHNKCPECTVKIRSEKSKIQKEEIIEIFEEAGYKILQMDYKNIDSRVLCQDKDGFIGTFSAHGVKMGHKMNPFDYQRNTKENIVHNLNLLLQKRGQKLKIIDFLGKTEDYTTNVVKCICPKCGAEFNMALATMRYGKDCCFNCTNVYSQYSIKVERWLNKHNIPYVREKRFKDCVDISPLPFDFYIESKNTCIEVDGEGHFYPVKFKGIEESVAIKHYNSTVKHDKIKNEYCKKNGINLIRISYKDIKNNNYTKKLSKYL